MDLNKFLVEFTNKGRFEVFKSIYRESKRHSQLERELNIPGPEISRNLKRLCKKSLVDKVDNMYQITSLGKIFYQVLEIFEMSLIHEDFFNKHEVDAIPLHLILQLGSLKTVKTNAQTMQNIQSWSELVEESEDFILAISEQFQDSILPIIEKKINNQSIEIKALIDEVVLTDSAKVGKKFKDRHSFYDKIDIFRNVRIIKKYALSLIVSDKGAILFLSKDGKIDYSQCLIDTDHSFINWAKELFEWYWNKGKDLGSFIKK